jgi:hypothetical protein
MLGRDRIRHPCDWTNQNDFYLEGMQNNVGQFIDIHVSQ